MTMCFRPKVFMQKRVNGSAYTLYLKTDIQAAIAYENMIQNRLNIFRNVHVEPYIGRKYKHELFSWLVVDNG